MIRARVKVVLEIDVSDSWNEDVKPSQVRQQATESAMGAIARGVTIGGRPGNDTDPATRGWASVVGTPEVTAIFIPLGPK